MPPMDAGSGGYGAVVPIKPKRSGGKIAAIVCAAVVGVLALLYIAGAVFFMGRFFPNTYVGDTDLSLKSLSEVRSYIDDSVQDYELDITGMGFDLSLSAEDAGITVDSQAVVDGMHEDASPWAWPLEVFRQHDETEKLAASYDQTGFNDFIKTSVEQFNVDKQPPVNATIAFDELAGEFVVQDEQVGTTLDADAVIASADAALLSLEHTVKLTEDHLVQPSVLSDDPALQTARNQANSFLGTDLDLTLGGTDVASVDAALVSQWVVLGEDLSASLNQDALSAWVDQLVAQCNTVGTERVYTRADGKKVTVSGGVYGWEIDRDGLLAVVQQAVPAHTVATQEIPCLSTAAVAVEPGKRDWGSRYIDIDLTEQHVRFYGDDGSIIWESDCISGVPNEERETPTGVYKINRKSSPETLNVWENGRKDHETVVQYWMPFVDNLIGLHDADWQPDFGGTMYKDGYGSHGCVNLPPSKAAELYELVQVGDCVVCHW